MSDKIHDYAGLGIPEEYKKHLDARLEEMSERTRGMEETAERIEAYLKAVEAELKAQREARGQEAEDEAEVPTHTRYVLPSSLDDDECEPLVWIGHYRDSVKEMKERRDELGGQLLNLKGNIQRSQREMRKNLDQLMRVRKMLEKPMPDDEVNTFGFTCLINEARDRRPEIAERADSYAEQERKRGWISE